MYKRHLYRCEMLSLECKFSELWFLINFELWHLINIYLPFMIITNLLPKYIFKMKVIIFILKHFLLFLLSLEIHLRGSCWPIQLAGGKNLVGSVFLPFSCFDCGYCKIATATAMSVNRRKKAEMRAISTRNLQSPERIKIWMGHFEMDPKRRGWTLTCLLHTHFYSILFRQLLQILENQSHGGDFSDSLHSDSIMLNCFHGP